MRQFLQASESVRWSSVDEACDRVVRVATRIAPNQSVSNTMQGSYRTYRKIYPALQSGIHLGYTVTQQALPVCSTRTLRPLMRLKAAAVLLRRFFHQHDSISSNITHLLNNARRPPDLNQIRGGIRP